MMLSEIEKDGSKIKIKREKDLKEALKNAYVLIKFQDFKDLYVSVCFSLEKKNLILNDLFIKVLTTLP